MTKVKCIHPFCGGTAKPAESGGMICTRCGRWW